MGIHDETCGLKRGQHLLFLPCEDTVRRQTSAGQKDSYHCVSVTVLLPPKVTYGRRDLFWFTVPGGEEPSMAGKHGHSSDMVARAES